MKQVILIFFTGFCILQNMHSQTTDIYTDSNGNRYAAIKSKGLPESRIEDRTKNPDFYTSIQLYEYTENGQNTKPVTDDAGNEIKEKRTLRHNEHPNSGKIGQKVSMHFIVSPNIVDSNGSASLSGETMNWATANGYLATANSNIYSTDSYAVPKGCAMYKGKNGKDEKGTWRVPTLREASLIMIFYKELEATSAQTDFQPFVLPSSGTSGTDYWMATEYQGNYSNACYMRFYPDAIAVQYRSSRSEKTDKYYLRCIRDIPSE
ncbi:DUF1566 domain-containing protein [Bacteroides ovatus]|nr:DUF1566 domain-containing protein [Bacteroides ovatus]